MRDIRDPGFGDPSSLGAVPQALVAPPDVLPTYSNGEVWGWDFFLGRQVGPQIGHTFPIPRTAPVIEFDFSFSRSFFFTPRDR